MERSKDKFKGNNYYSKVILAMLSLIPDQEATVMDVSFAWSFLQNPEDIVLFLGKRDDVVAWAANYPDRISTETSLLHTLIKMVNDRQILAHLNPVNPKLDPKVYIAHGFVFAKTGKGMDDVFMDVRYAMEAVEKMKVAQAKREAIEQAKGQEDE